MMPKDLKQYLLILLIFVGFISNVYADRLIIGDNSEFILYGLPYISHVVENDVLYVHQYGVSGKPMYLCFESSCEKENIVIKSNGEVIVDVSNIDSLKKGSVYCFRSNDLVPPDSSEFITLTFQCGQNFEKSLSYTRTYLEAYTYEISFPYHIKVLKEAEDSYFRTKVYYLNATPQQDISFTLKLRDANGYVVDTSQFSIKKAESLNLHNGKYSSLTIELCQPQAVCVNYVLPVSSDNSVYKEYFVNMLLSKFQSYSPDTTFSTFLKIVPRPLDIKLYISENEYKGDGLFVKDETLPFKIEPVMYGGDVIDIQSIRLKFYDSSNNMVKDVSVQPNTEVNIKIPNTGMNGKLKVFVSHRNGNEYVFEYDFKTFDIAGIIAVEKDTYHPGDLLKGNITLNSIKSLNPTIENLTLHDSNGKFIKKVTKFEIGEDVVNFSLSLPYNLGTGSYLLVLNLSVTYNNKKIYSTDSLSFNVVGYGDNYVLEFSCGQGSVECNEEKGANATFSSVIDEKILALIFLNKGISFNISDVSFKLNETLMPEEHIHFNVTGKVEAGKAFKSELTIAPLYYLSNNVNEDLLMLKMYIKTQKILELPVKIFFDSNAKPLNLKFVNQNDTFWVSSVLNFELENAPLTIKNVNATFVFSTDKGVKEIEKKLTSRTFSVEIPVDVVVKEETDAILVVKISYMGKEVLTKQYSFKIKAVLPYHHQEMLDKLKKVCDCKNAPSKCSEYERIIKEKKEKYLPIPKEIYDFVNSNPCGSSSSSSKESEESIETMRSRFMELYQKVCVVNRNKLLDAMSAEEAKTFEKSCNDFSAYEGSLDDVPDEELEAAYNLLKSYSEKLDYLNVQPSSTPEEESKNTVLIIGIILAVISVIGVAVVIYKTLPKGGEYDDYEIEEDL